MTATRSATWRTTPRSWLTSTKVRRKSRIRSRSRLITCACTETSKALTGSSPMIRRGLLASARAIAMRWRCPPENSCGQRPAFSGRKPTRRSNSPTRAASSARGTTRCSRNGSAMACATVMRGSRLPKGSWKMICISRLRARKAAGERLARSSPAKRTEPLSGSIRRSMTRPSVDLPQPLSPTMASTSPSATESDTPSTACTAPARRPSASRTGKCFTTSRSSNNAVMPPPPACHPAARAGRR